VVDWTIPASLGGAGADDPVFKACVQQVWTAALKDPEAVLNPTMTGSAMQLEPATTANDEWVQPSAPPAVAPWVPPSDTTSVAEMPSPDQLPVDASSDRNPYDCGDGSSSSSSSSSDGGTDSDTGDLHPDDTASAIVPTLPAQRFAIKEAGGLPLDLDEGGADKQPDPYVKVILGNKLICKTKTKKNTQTPRWAGDNVFEIESGPADRRVILELWDWDKGLTNRDDQLGTVELTVAQLNRIGRPGFSRPLTLQRTGGYNIWLELHRLGCGTTISSPRSSGSIDSDAYEEIDRSKRIAISASPSSVAPPTVTACDTGSGAGAVDATTAALPVDADNAVTPTSSPTLVADTAGADVHDVDISLKASRSLNAIGGHLTQAVWCLRECHEIALDQTRRPLRRGYKFTAGQVDLLAQKYFYTVELQEQFVAWRTQLMRSVDEDLPELLDTLVAELRKVLDQVRGGLGDGRWDHDLFGFKTNTRVRRAFKLYMRMVQDEMRAFLVEGDAIVAEVHDDVAPEAKEAERELIQAFPSRVAALAEHIHGIRDRVNAVVDAWPRPAPGQRSARKTKPLSQARRSLIRLSALLAEILFNELPGKPAFSRVVHVPSAPLEIYLGGASDSLRLCTALMQMLLPLTEILGNLAADGVAPPGDDLSAAYTLADDVLKTWIPAVVRVARRCIPYVIEAKTRRLLKDDEPSNLELLLRGDAFEIVRPQQALIRRLQAEQRGSHTV
jgi:hypothetical protein